MPRRVIAYPGGQLLAGQLARREIKHDPFLFMSVEQEEYLHGSKTIPLVAVPTSYP